MKKIGLILFAIVSLIGSLFGQTQRVILYEDFKSTSCAACYPYPDDSIVALTHRAGNFPSKILMICTHSSWPQEDTLYKVDTADANSRLRYYSIGFVPYARFDGILLPDSSNPADDGNGGLLRQSYITDSAIINSPFALTIGSAINITGDSVTITATVTAAQAYTALSSGSLKLKIALEEAYIHYSSPPENEGIQNFYYEMRKMVPSASGTVLNDNWLKGAFQVISIKVPIPPDVMDKSQIAFVAYVQDDVSKRVHQSAYCKSSLSLDLSLNMDNSLIQCTVFNPYVIIKNRGTHQISTCTVKYRLDTKAVKTFKWTGVLKQGDSSIVPLPTMTTTVGIHHVWASTSLPNDTADQNPYNDSSSYSYFYEPTVTTTPISEGFEGGTFPPNGWISDIQYPSSNCVEWGCSNDGGGYGTSSHSAFVPFSYFYECFSIAGEKEELYLPYINLSSIPNPALKFDYAYRPDTNRRWFDSLAIMISVDCGYTWSQLMYNGGPGLSTDTAIGTNSAFIPSDSNWKTKIIDLSTYSSASAALLKFVTSNYYNSAIYIDNVNLNTVTGIENIENITTINVYPNPSNGKFTIKQEGVSDKEYLKVYNMMGEEVLNEILQPTQGENEIDLSNESSGVYLYRITTIKGVIIGTGKLMIK